MELDNIETFVENIFKNKAGSIAKQELLSKASQSGMGPDEKNVLDQLPDRNYNKDELIATLKNIVAKQGASKIGSMFKKAA